MLKATLKSLLAHKVRLALTSLAIVLGVGFVAGSLVLTDTLNATFIRLFKQVDGGVDVRVRSFETFSESGNRGNSASKYQPVPASLVDEVRAVPGVRGVSGGMSGYAQMIDRNGKVIGGAGPPTLGVSISQDPGLSRVTFSSGRAPANGAEVAIDAATAKKQKFAVGDRIKILLTASAQEFTVSGVFKVGDADTLAGATIAAFDVETAHVVLNRPGTFDAIDVKAAAGVSQATVRDRIFTALGGRYDVVTGQQLAAQEAQDVYNGFIKFLGTALLIFAGVALFVGTFIISNTFSIIVAGRTRELALLRALGAGRGQVMGSVLGEALITGVVSSGVGVGFGVLVANLLKRLLAAFGGKLPTSPAVVAGSTVAIALVLGVVVTLLSALLPAVRATRIPPVAALRGEGIPGFTGSRVRRVRLVIGSLFLLAGAGLLAQGLVVGKAVTVGAGAAAFIVGVVVLAVLIARTLARIIGAPMARAFKLPGRLAQQNAMRNPARTSATAAALMVGLALVTFVSVFASSIKASLAATFDRSFAADYVIVSNSFEGFSAAVADDLRRVPEVAGVAPLNGGQFRLEGKTVELSAAPLATYTRLIKLKLAGGEVPPDDAGGLLVLDTVARDHRWKVGDTVPMEFAKTGVQPVRISGTFKRNDFAGKYLLSRVDYARNFLNNQALVVVVKAAPGVAPAASRAAIEPVLERYPNTTLKDQAQYKAKVSSSVNQILSLVTVLLLLAIVIAVIGIVNTLALSVIERTRELGLLRAVGLSRRQTRRMIRWESVIIAVIGATLGLAVGLFFGWALVTAIHDQGITEFAVPVGRLAAYVVAAGVFGVIAAILPARRAARLNVLAAIAYE